MAADLLLVFGIGLLGSLHCAGMCGPFVLALGHLHGRAGTFRRHQALYFLGKTTTYAVLGAVVGGLGAVLGAALLSAQQVLAVLAGVVLVLIGLGMLGVTRRLDGRLPVNTAWLTAGLRRLLGRRSASATFGLGLLNGLLPCGLVYALLAKAALTGSVLGGALTMAVFGAATLPALALAGWVGHLLRPAWRSRLTQVSGVLVLGLGLLVLWRGTPVEAWLTGEPAPTEETCH